MWVLTFIYIRTMSDVVIRIVYYSPVCSIHEVQNENHGLCFRLTPHHSDGTENYALNLTDLINESCLTFEEKQKVLGTLDLQE